MDGKKIIKDFAIKREEESQSHGMNIFNAKIEEEGQ